MVRINRITLRGFKSFADKVSIPFPTGFNVIAGPNGSGKSNIVDAIMFVLGVSSAKMIRANKLQTLIFNGGKDRKPASYAEVSLYLDNKDGQIPLKEEEIKITRKVNRKGTSVYKINGKNVTKRKFVDILANANLYADGYNIIVQGDVTRVIEMNTQERKGIIDDICGIAEFDEKKKKAMQELEHIETRVREMLIIVNEKERLKRKLEEEKRNAEKYLQLEKKLEKLKASLIKKKLENAQDEWNAISAQIKNLENEFTRLNEKFSSVDKEVENAEKQIQKLQNEIIKKTKDFSTSKKIDELSVSILRKRDKIELNKREIERIEKFLGEVPKNRAVKQIAELKKDGVYGTFSSIISTKKEYETAIQTAIRGHESDIIVDSTNLAIELVKFLKRQKIGQARFLPLDRIKGKKKTDLPEELKKEGIGFAIDLLSYDPKYKNIVEYVLGNTFIVKTIEDAKHIIKKTRIKIVTLDGDVIEPSGAIRGGYNIIKGGKISIRKTEEEKKKLEEENKRLKEEIKSLTKKMENLKKLKKKEFKGTSELEEKISKLEKCIKERKNSRKDLFEKRMEFQRKISELKIKRAKKEAILDNLKIEKNEFKHIKKFYNEPVDELRNKIRAIISEINKIGPVNLRAIEEYKIADVEFGELKLKLDKLLDEKGAILKTAEEIESKRKGRFMETLKKIEKNFSVIYKDLTGGEGVLKLEERENIDSGLVIEAIPKGKSLVNIDLMSGGEKAITALAFLFAIQQYKSAPFYVLDEVDASLDKANTKKINNLIKKYSKNMQFIVITHNETTLAVADKLFGVSMQDGVSKILAIKMPEK